MEEERKGMWSGFAVGGDRASSRVRKAMFVHQRAGKTFEPEIVIQNPRPCWELKRKILRLILDDPDIFRCAKHGWKGDNSWLTPGTRGFIAPQGKGGL